jgi:hypothetical protein
MPIDVKNLLVKLLVLLLLWLHLLEVLLELPNLEPDLLKLHNKGKKILNAQFFFVG